MEKQLFISTLKEKAGVDNVSERSFDEVAALFLPQFADDSKITDESWGIPVQMVKTMSGQMRHDISGGIAAFKAQFEADNKAAQAKAIADAVAAAKVEWEKTHTQTPPVTPPVTPPATPPTEATLDQKIADAIAKAMGGLTGDDGALGKLTKQFTEFTTQLAAERKAQTEAQIRDEVRDYLIGRGVDELEDEFELEYTLERLVIGDKPDLKALKTKAEQDFEAVYKRTHKGGGQPFASGSSNDEASGAAEWLKANGEISKQEAAAAEARKSLLK